MDFENVNISKTTLITVLIIVIILSFLGINLFTIIGYYLNQLILILSPFVLGVLSTLGYTLGTTINTAADVSSSAATTGVDIAKGTAHSVGNLLKSSSSNQESMNLLDNKINNSKKRENFIDNDSSYSCMQNPLSCNKKLLYSNSNNYSFINDPQISLTGHI